MKLYDRYEGKKLYIAEKIQRRRLQLLVHSYIYYVLDDNIISDAKWSTWAKELAELQRKYPNMSKRISYAEEFTDWDGSTGAFLKFDTATIQRAQRLLKCKRVPTKKIQHVVKPSKKQGKQKKRRLF